MFVCVVRITVPVRYSYRKYSYCGIDNTRKIQRLAIYLSVCFSVYLLVCLSVCLSLSFSPFLPLFVSVFVSPPLSFINVSHCLSVCDVNGYLQRYFAPLLGRVARIKMRRYLFLPLSSNFCYTTSCLINKCERIGDIF